MGKYHLAYSGGSMPETDEGRQASMEAWGAWFGALGESILDPGNPFGPSKSVSGKGVSDAGAAGLTGYTLVKASNLDAAVALAKGCPIISDGGFVDVYETFDVKLT